MPDTHAKPPDTPTTSAAATNGSGQFISGVNNNHTADNNQPIPESCGLIKSNAPQASAASKHSDAVTSTTTSSPLPPAAAVTEDLSSTTTASAVLDASIADELAKIYRLLGRTLPPLGTDCDLDDPTTKKVRICVLIPSYADSDSATKDWDDIPCGPQNYLLNPSTTALYQVQDDGGDDGSTEDNAGTPPHPHPTTTPSTPSVFMGSYFEIETVALQKASCFKTIRSLISSNKYDVFFNLCDGGEDEDRAGVEVVRTLEKFGAPFTGAEAKYYEVSKPTMKMVAHYNNILAPRGVVIKSPSDVPRKCNGLTFPVIIKHASGYGSVGMTKDCKCTTMEELQSRIIPFIKEYDVALVEEFITGSEATVLACADDTQPDGVRVFIPVMVSFPPGEDFKHFDLKWRDFDGMQWVPVSPDHTTTMVTAADEDDVSSPSTDKRCLPTTTTTNHVGVVTPAPAAPTAAVTATTTPSPYDAICDMGRKAFKSMCGGVGYGRCDVRIAEGTNDVYFLEINPNCGILYPDGLEGSADWILKLDPTSSHVHFILLQIRTAIARSQAMKPIFTRDYTPARGYHLIAERDIQKGTTIIASSSSSSSSHVVVTPTTSTNHPRHVAPQPTATPSLLLPATTSNKTTLLTGNNNNNHAADVHAAQQMIHHLLSLDNTTTTTPPVSLHLPSPTPPLLQWGDDPDLDWHPINHTCSARPNVCWYTHGDLVALCDIEAGSELLLNYHHHHNHGDIGATTTAFTFKIAPCPSCGNKDCHLILPTSSNSNSIAPPHHHQTATINNGASSSASSTTTTTTSNTSSPDISCTGNDDGGAMMAVSLGILDQILMVDSQQQRPAFGFSPSSPEGPMVVPISSFNTTASTSAFGGGGFREVGGTIINR